MRRLRLRVAPNATGLEADLAASSRAPRRSRSRASSPATAGACVMDSTRFTQWGGWERQRSRSSGERIAPRGRPRCSARRDRSWGLRRVGEPEGGAPGVLPPQFFWLWAPAPLRRLLHALRRQRGRRGPAWHWNGNRVPALRVAGEGAIDDDARRRAHGARSRTRSTGSRARGARGARRSCSRRCAATRCASSSSRSSPSRCSGSATCTPSGATASGRARRRSAASAGSSPTSRPSTRATSTSSSSAAPAAARTTASASSSSSSSAATPRRASSPSSTEQGRSRN